ncbi:MAG: META domain-containing protein, partial [Myxococcaceae bacterium]|nr:META domain-containing protein [Myxococcaceae bacterium]
EVMAAPTLEEARKATYRGLTEAPASVTLVDGTWTGAPFVDGGAARPEVGLVPDFLVTGNLDGDATPEALALVTVRSGGSGEWVHLAVLDRRGSGLDNVATQLLGDRVQVRDVRVEDGRILVDVVQHGPSDAQCCPGELRTLGWRLDASGRLVPLAEVTQPGRLTLDALGDTVWVLRAWDVGVPAPAEPEVTLQFEEGRFAGSAGCNRYVVGVRPGAAPGELHLQPEVATTRMICPGPAQEVEDRFLRQLAGVRRFGFLAGQLALTVEQNGRSSTLLFERRR